jgi:hypothetical protein
MSVHESCESDELYLMTTPSRMMMMTSRHDFQSTSGWRMDKKGTLEYPVVDPGMHGEAP